MADDKGSPTILLGIGGGVAAFKAVSVASALHQQDCDVHVAMTPAARHFVDPWSFTAVIRRRVHTDMFGTPASDDLDDLFRHLYPATRATACILLPATAGLMARVAWGFADDVVAASAVALPADCRRYFCPAMNVNMWQQQTVQENAARLRDLGWCQIGPGSGRLACGTSGNGRMTEPEEIVDIVLGDLRGGNALAGKRVLIVSGPTVEHLDPVRFLSNHSSGLMGRALALAAVRQGARVDFVTGPVPPANLPVHPHVDIVPVTSAATMLEKAGDRFPTADAAIFVAAVADYTPAEPVDRKLPKSGDRLTIDLVPTPDIAATLAADKRADQVCIGFALETDDGPAKARAKLARKHLDAIVLNDPGSFGAAAGTFTWIAPETHEDWGTLDKAVCADRIVARLG